MSWPVSLVCVSLLFGINSLRLLVCAAQAAWSLVSARGLAWLVLAASAAVLGSRATLTPCTVEKKLREVSQLKGVCMICVGIIHSASPKTLNTYAVHRYFIDRAVDVLLVCAGLVHRPVVPQACLRWYAQRANKIVPCTLATLGIVWTWKLCHRFWDAYRFVGGKRAHPLLIIVQNYAGQPGCIGGLWFLTAFAQCLIAMPWMDCQPFAVAAILFAAARVMSGDWFAQRVLSTECGALFESTAVERLFYVAAGMCLRRVPAGSGPRLASGLAITTLVLLVTEQTYPALFGAFKVVHTVLLAHTARHHAFPAPDPVLEWIGDQSYIFYMGHVIALNVFVKDFTIDTYLLLPDTSVWLRAAVFLSASCGLGAVLARFVPMHALWWVAAVPVALTFVPSLSPSPPMCPPPPKCPLPPKCPSPVTCPPPVRCPPPAVAASRSWVPPPAVVASPRSWVPPPVLSTRVRYAYFTLLRGGSQEIMYESYKKRCAALSAYRDVRTTDDLAFHEGNVPSAIARALTAEHKVRVLNVQDYGGFLDADVMPRFPIRTSGSYAVGYNHMCRFFGILWMHVLQRYSIVARIDEDVIVHSMNAVNPFAYLEQKRLDYVYALETTEKHSETVQTMQPWLDEWRRRHGRAKPVGVEDMYFTNVFVSRTDWWLRDDVQGYLKDVDASGHIFMHRWGDAPIQSTALRIFDGRAGLMRIDYSHGSTQNEIKGGKEIQYRSTERRDRAFERAMRMFDEAAPCLVASHFGIESEEHAADALRARIMLEMNQPKAVVDTLSDTEVAFSYQLDVRKRKDGPLPPDELSGVDRLEYIARALGLRKWESDRVAKTLHRSSCRHGSRSMVDMTKLLRELKNMRRHRS